MSSNNHDNSNKNTKKMSSVQGTIDFPTKHKKQNKTLVEENASDAAGTATNTHPFPYRSVEVIEDGLVIIRGILSQEEQRVMAKQIMQIGTSTEYGFWKKVSSASSSDTRKNNIINDGNQKRESKKADDVDEEEKGFVLNATKTRGRIYQSIDWYNTKLQQSDGQGQGQEQRKIDDDRGQGYEAQGNVLPFSTICQRAVEIGCRSDPSGTLRPMTPTHMLLLYYATNRGISWHRDEGENDGTGDLPIVSFTLGNACDFAVKHNREDPARKVKLESGDVLLFGGPCRLILHSVTKVYKGSCPPWLTDTVGDARLNLTFREAPEAIGREEKDFGDFFKAIKLKRKATENDTTSTTSTTTATTTTTAAASPPAKTKNAKKN